MKVILLKDVKKLGKEGDIVEVNNGYGRNYILPKKIGVEVNNENLNDLKLQNENEKKLAKENLEAAKALKEDLEAKKVTVKIKAGKEGRTFGSVSTKDIQKAIKEDLKLDIDKKKIVLKDTIKSLGTYNVTIKLHKKVSAKVRLSVEAE